MRIGPEKNLPGNPDDLLVGFKSHELSIFLKAWKGEQVLMRTSFVSGAFTCVTLLNLLRDPPEELSYPHLYG